MLSNLQYLPFFGWLGVVGVIGIWIAVIIMQVARKQKKPKLRKWHVLIGAISLLIATVHGLWALSLYL